MATTEEGGRLLSQAVALTHLTLDGDQNLTVDCLRAAFEGGAAQRNAGKTAAKTLEKKGGAHSRAARPITHLSLAGCCQLHAGLGLVLAELTNLRHLILDRTAIIDQDLADIMQHCGVCIYCILRLSRK